MVSALDRLSYAARQTARVAWYAGHYAAGRRLLKPMPKPDFAVGPTPTRAELTAEMRTLFQREWRDVAAGLFPAPRLLGPEPTEFLRRSLLYFRDLPQVDARRHGTLDDELPPGTQADGLPDYYRQNFHFQSDGWLSDHSAALYDTQVEVLFTGAADVMRRRALAPIATWLAGRNQRDVRGLDVGCGTGRLLAALHGAWPGLKLTGIDLSKPYLEEARRLIGRTARVKLDEAAAESLPFDEASLDLVVSSFLLHELPNEIRVKVIAEMARVAKPGGLVVIVDSLRRGTVPTGTACSTSSRTISTSRITPSTRPAASTRGSARPGFVRYRARTPSCRRSPLLRSSRNKELHWSAPLPWRSCLDDQRRLSATGVARSNETALPRP